MDTTARHRSGGRAARQAARLASHAEHVPFLTRKLAPFEVLDDEGLSLIEHNADTILQEVGLEFRGDADALRLFRDAGADVQGERVRFPRGMCRQIVQATAPRQFSLWRISRPFTRGTSASPATARATGMRAMVGRSAMIPMAARRGKAGIAPNR